MPLLVDFAVRLAGGLAGWLLLTPWRLVPPAFFRTHGLVMLGLLALASYFAPAGTVRILLIVAAVLAYLASIGWGLGLQRLGAPATWGVLLAAGIVLVWGCWGDAVVLPSGARLASGFLMGSTLSAMLLGHHYLIAPAMSIAPLRRFVRGMAVALAVRAALALPGSWAWVSAAMGSRTDRTAWLLFFVRWGMGIAAAALACGMAWKTVQIRSTQSATGILYIAMTLVLMGELTAMVLTRDTGMLF